MSQETLPAPPIRHHQRRHVKAGRWVLVCILPSLLAACRPATQTSTGASVISIGIPVRSGDDERNGVNAFLNSLTLEAPISMGWDGKPGGKVIDDWQWSGDGLTLRLHLQPHVTFHDGTPLTADLAAAIIRDGLARDDEGAVSSTVQSVVPEGDWIVIHTGRREGFLLSDIAALNFALPGKPGLGTGPFVLESRDPIRLTASAGYRTGPPFLDVLRVQKYDSQRAAWAALMRGDVDVLHEVTSDAVEFLNAESAVQTYSFRKAYYNLMLVNMDHPVLGRREVRQALNEAVDRDEIVRFALKGRGSPAVGPVWTDHFAFNREINDAIRHDPAAAAARLNAAGLPAGVRRGPGQMPSRFAFTCLVVQEDPQLERIGLVLQKQLFELGVDMQLKAVPFSGLRAALKTRQFDAALLQFASSRSLSYVYTFWHSPGRDVRSAFPGTYAGADAALDALRAALTEEEIRAAVPKVQQAFVDDPPGVILDWLETSRAVRRTIHVPAEPGRDILGSIARWTPADAPAASR